MTQLARYLKTHYYPRYAAIKPYMVPDEQALEKALRQHIDKTIVVRYDNEICGVAVYLKLDDKTYANLESFDLCRIDVLARLMEQNGENFHFILVTADCAQTLRVGLRYAKSLHPKTISWWNPTMTKLHKLVLKGA